MGDNIYESVLELIGHTPLVRLNRITGDIAAEIWCKLEYYNPSGSIKDRIALYMIEEAERRGLLKPGDIVVEPTSGNTGTALALVCALKGYRMIAVMPEAMSEERKDMMRAFGAELVLIPSQGNAIAGTFTREDLEATVQKAQELAAQPGYFMPNQFANPANSLAHREMTAEEIWTQTQGRIDVFVAGVGTSGTAMGVSQRLKAYNPAIKIYIVEPAASAVISGEKPGYHRIQGIGEGFVPDLLDWELFDGIIKVTDEEAKSTACRLSRMEGIFAGYSAGANVFAALLIARELGAGKVVVTVIPDSGMKYLSTELFRRDPKLCAIQCCTLSALKRSLRCAEVATQCCVLEPCEA